jgi:hypothetical protein
MIDLRWTQLRNLCIVLAVALSSTAMAGDEPRAGKPEFSPAPSRLRLALYSGDAGPVHLTVHDGQVARLRREADGMTFGLAATFDATAGKVLLTFYRTDMEDGPVTATDVLGTAELALDGTRVRMPVAVERTIRANSAGMQTPEIAFLGLATRSDTTPRRCTGAALISEEPVPTNLRPNGCCLTCDGWTACGCAVEICNQKCCVGECC